MTLTIFDALSAPTGAEFHKRISALPVTIARKSVETRNGKKVLEVEYRLNGVLKARVLETRRSDGARVAPRIDGSVAAPEMLDASGLSMEDGTSSSHSNTSAFAAAATYCEFTDRNNTLWTGECASQQEFDDALVVKIALDAEVAAVQQEVVTYSTAYCREMGTSEDCQWATDDESVLEGPLAEVTPAIAAMSVSYSFSAVAVGQSGPNARACGSAGWGFAGALGAFGLATGYLSTTLASYGSAAAIAAGTAATVGAVGFALAGGVVCAIGVIAAANAVDECQK